MSSTQHPLPARVYVNRIWRWHFGTGLVRSTENFGALGDRPSHPQLLDWLARRFMESGWSTKQLHRLILYSSTYQMSSHHPRQTLAAEVDPENRLLHRFPVQRLEVEQIRDGMLYVSRRLDLSIGGKTVPLRNRQFVFNHTSVDHTRYDSLRRAMYLPVIRNNIYPMFAQYDFPDPTMPTGDRQSTVVAPQALLMMNSPLVIESASALADRWLRSRDSDPERLRLAYRETLGRYPSEHEITRDLSFLNSIRPREGGVEATEHLRAWSLLCQALFASNEFIYIR